MPTQKTHYLSELRELNTWYTIHNDCDNQWIVFEYEWVILMFQMSQNNKGNHKTV